jgi:UDP-2,4-diacetamido-2,4,6-trideoxy-beta-L-altropyranose hydrolase
MSSAVGKRILLRADASPQIGNGHVMRMLALGQAWLEQGGSATLATRTVAANLLEQVQRECIDVCRLDGNSMIDESVWLRDFAHAHSFDFIVLDGYQFSTEYQRELRNGICGTMVVDDCTHLPLYDADLILNQNIGVKPEDYLGHSKGAKILAGLEYCLLRREFRSLNFESRKSLDRSAVERSTTVHVLITLGGADPENISRSILAGFELLRDLGICVRVVVGSNNSHIASLRAMASQDSRVEIVTDVEDMTSQYWWADIAVVAGGSTNWELCRFEIPRLVVVLADNQETIAKRLEQAGLAINLGRGSLLAPQTLAEAAHRLICDPYLRQFQSDRCRDLVDGLGATRVVNEILNVIDSRE